VAFALALRLVLINVAFEDEFTIRRSKLYLLHCAHRQHIFINVSNLIHTREREREREREWIHTSPCQMILF